MSPSTRRTSLQALFGIAVLAASSAVAGPSAVPRVLGPVPDPMKARLASAFDVARERVARRPACRDLYRDLDRSGVDSLEATRYLVTTLRERQRLCDRRVSAFTVPGGLTTRLCPSFSRLPTPRAAAVLIHESLHTAGLPESPLVPEAMRSSEINDLVARRCGL